jgi:RNA polymerase sigma-70 factor (ECF subfamily)
MVHLMNEGIKTEKFSFEALRAGDKEEFARMVETYSGLIFRLAFKMLNNTEDAEDILQETFIKAYRSLKGFDGRARLSTWLYRIATNEALMKLRKKNPNIISIDEPVETDEGEREPLQIVDWCCLPEGELMNSENRAYLDKAIDNLPQTLKVVFLLRDIEGLSTQEVVETLNLSETAVKTRLSRARLRLREELSVYYAERLEKK